MKKKIIESKLKLEIEKNKVIHKNQFGYIKNKFTENARSTNKTKKYVKKAVIVAKRESQEWRNHNSLLIRINVI